MSWTIERRGRVAVVTMTTNKVNAQNRRFFADLHDTFDHLEAEHPESPVVLTGQGGRFSAGLDLGEHFPLFAGPPADGVAEWFAEYRATNMRLFTYPRPTVAAVNGHAFAGGLITSAVCDRRTVVDSGARFSLNEVPIGIPMPAVYVRMLAYAWGERTAARASLFGETFDQDEAFALGMFDELVPAEQLVDRGSPSPTPFLPTPWSSTPSPSGPLRPLLCATSPTCPTPSTSSCRSGSRPITPVTPTAATGGS